MGSRKSAMSDDSIVVIKPEAYYKMLVHILRFGAKTIQGRGYKEVMGILIGRLEGDGTRKNVIVEDAVPISHGGSIEVRFAPEDYVSFSMIDERFAKENLFSVGWYHSHPALDIFFSGTDIMNQLGWQTANPSAIGIVFDHTYLEKPGDLGFRTFRLDDPSKGESSGYHEVKTKVEEPDSLEFYNRIIDLISSINTGEPPILEINETTDILGEISFPSDGELMVKKPEKSTNKILDNLKIGLFNILEAILEPILNRYNEWGQNLLITVMNQNLSLKDNLINVKDILKNQFKDIQKDFKTNLNDFFNDLEFFIDDKLDILDKKVEEINNTLTNLEEDLSNQINRTITEIKEKNIHNIDEIYQKGISNFAEMRENSEMNEDLISKQKTLLNTLIEQQNTIQEEIEVEISTHLAKKSEEFEKKYQIINKIIDKSEKRAESLQSKFMDSLSILESSVDPLKDKIEGLNTDKKVLQNKIDKAHSKINDYEKQINNLEKDNEKLKEDLSKFKEENQDLSKKIKKLEKKVENTNG
ncbi:MAG: Mov34/MPN/PAD-1 family protein [Promethearchaeati archaeon]